MRPSDQINEAQALLDVAPDHASAPTRRTALKLGLGVGVGYAAGEAVMAQTAISTPSDGLLSGEVQINVNGTAIAAYRSQPEGQTGLPVVLVLSEIFGVHEYIADITRRLARLGYLAIAPELFARQGDAKSYTDIPTLMREVVAKVPDAQVTADVDATVAWAAANGGDTARLAVTGFCWGGRQTWLYAMHNPQVKAGVAWYGRLEGQGNPLQPRHPLELAAELKAPVLGLYGEADTGISLDSVAKMKAALKAAGEAGNAAAAGSEFVTYGDAPHAFHADYRPSYRPRAAEDGWGRMLAWFKSHGVA